jgi:hypothetical protein
MPSLAHTGVMVACLCLLLRVGCLDITFQRRDGSRVDVDELHADVEYILGKAFRMYDPRGGIEGQPGLRRQLQFELDLDHDTRDLSGGSLVSRENMMDGVTPAAEFETTG